MGSQQSSQPSEAEAGSVDDGDVNFDSFTILRAIGKGSFGKVCIVKKKIGGKMFALKYMNKAMCIEKNAVKNVLKEVDILTRLEHPFLVNLWYTFSDEEDLFLVVDLLLGGDLRFHLQQRADGKIPAAPGGSGGLFNESQMAFYACQMGLALDYLREQHVLHRDLKPDNLLFDDEGNLHLTDFNVATELEDGELARSISGTKPYMALEVFGIATGDTEGYSFEADWWSLGVTAYEMLRSKRPFDIQGNTSLPDCAKIIKETKLSFSSHTSTSVMDLLSRLMSMDPCQRICCVESLMSQPAMQSLMSGKSPEAVLSKQISSSFTPPKESLNCDPTFELEEMIIESKPLHKKKKRLAKANKKNNNGEEDPNKPALDEIDRSFKPFNRVKALEALAAAAAQVSDDAQSAGATDVAASAPPEVCNDGAPALAEGLTQVATN